MSHHVYILYSRTIKKYYTGSCSSVDKRLNEHNSGYSRFTKREIPWDVVKLIEVEDWTNALMLENKIKKRGAERFLSDR